MRLRARSVNGLFMLMTLYGLFLHQTVGGVIDNACILQPVVWNL